MSATDDTALTLSCSFCGKADKQVNKLVAGPGVYICDGCVELCVQILAEPEEHPDTQVPYWATSTDEEMLAHLPNVAAAGSQVDANLHARVGELRQRGVTWTRIGAALGTSRQAAWERFSGEE